MTGILVTATLCYFFLKFIEYIIDHNIVSRPVIGWSILIILSLLFLVFVVAPILTVAILWLGLGWSL